MKDERDSWASKYEELDKEFVGLTGCYENAVQKIKEAGDESVEKEEQNKDLLKEVNRLNGLLNDIRKDTSVSEQKM